MAGQTFLPVIARPDRSSIIGRISHKPQVLPGCGRTRLACNILTSKVGCLAGGAAAAGHNPLQHLCHIIGGALGKDILFWFGLVAQQHLFVVVDDHGIGFRLNVSALAGEYRICRCHLVGADTFRQASQCQLRQANICIGRSPLGQGLDELNVELILHEVKAGLCPHHIQHLDGHRVDRLLHRLRHGDVALVHASGVHRPISPVNFPIRAILHHGGRGHFPQLNGRGINRQGLNGGARRTLAAGGPVQAPAGGFFSHAAGHGHHFTSLIVHNGDGRLELLSAAGGHIQVVLVLIDLVHRSLDLGLHTGVDFQTAGEHLVFGILLRPVISLH